MVDQNNHTNEELKITLFVEGLGMKGSLISAERWREAFEKTATLPDALTVPDERKYARVLHLSGVSILGKKRRDKVQTALLRIRLDKISGWTVEG